MKFDLFISDFDWTLGCAPDVIDEGTVKAIKDYEKRGGKFCIATGRSFSSIKDICAKYGLKCVVACFQGAKIADLATDETLFEGGLDYKLAAKIAEEIEQDGVPVIAWVDDVLYYSVDSYYSDMYKNTEKVYYRRVKNVAKEVLSTARPVAKVCAVCEDCKTEELTARYAAKYGGLCTINSGSKRLIEAINPEYGKDFAVRFIAKKLGVSADKIIAAGDSTNDLEMAGKEWYFAAVGDAAESLKEKADEVTVPFNLNPVKVLLEKYCL